MKLRLLRKNFFLILSLDVLLLACAWYGAYLVRFELNIPQQFFKSFKIVLPLILIVKIISFYFFDLYRGMWRYTSIADLLNIIKATSIGSLLVISLVLFSTRFMGFPRSVFVIDWCLSILFISGLRLGVRLYFEHESEHKPWRAALETLFGS